MVYKKENLPYQHLVLGNETMVPLRNGQYVKAVNFDNAATTPPFLRVMEEIISLAPWYASVHRGSGYKSQFVSRYYESVRETVGHFIKADLKRDTILFVKNTTEAINKAAYLLASDNQRKVVLTSAMEHHSNDLPWRRFFQVDHIATDAKGRLSMDDLELKLKKYNTSLRLVAITGASNVSGYKNPIHRIAALAHQYGAEIFVDGAQLIPHSPFDMKPHHTPEHIDYLAFSAHKMYAPFGTGVLVGPKHQLSNKAPHMPGGGTVSLVTPHSVYWSELPQREEAGTPNLMGVAALKAAITCLREMGLENIDSHEKRLMAYAMEGLKDIPGLRLYGDVENLDQRVSIIPFNLEGFPHDLLAKILSMEGGIALRNGCFCAQPYIQTLMGISQEEIDLRIKDPTLYHPGMVRISFGCYNTYEEIDRLVYLLKHISTFSSYYFAHYQGIPDYF
ncbi:aminotransferase class V-fold PLP-dependent enzyme [Alkaliphilus crotonatoxidans]